MVRLRLFSSHSPLKTVLLRTRCWQILRWSCLKPSWSWGFYINISFWEYRWRLAIKSAVHCQFYVYRVIWRPFIMLFYLTTPLFSAGFWSQCQPRLSSPSLSCKILARHSSYKLCKPSASACHEKVWFSCCKKTKFVEFLFLYISFEPESERELTIGFKDIQQMMSLAVLDVTQIISPSPSSPLIIISSATVSI